MNTVVLTWVRGSSHVAPLGGFLGSCWSPLGTFARFRFEDFAVLMSVMMHWFGFVCFGRGGRSRGEALTSWTNFEDMDVLDFAASQLRWICTNGSHLQVNSLNPPR